MAKSMYSSFIANSRQSWVVTKGM